MKKMVLLLCVALVGCRSQQYIVPNDTITQTQTKTKTIERDSIYVHDSIYIIRYTKGDTVYNDRTYLQYKDRWFIRTDTLLRHDTTIVTQTQTITQTEKVRFVPKFYKWCTGIMWIIILAIIIRIALRLYIKHK